nr:thermonuclease family protein [Clostridium chromiireducens]
MISDSFVRKAKVEKVIDGDTLEVTIDLGFCISVNERIRLLRVNCPEMKGETRAKGEEAKQFTLGEVLGKEVMIISHKTDTFKRWLGEVMYENKDGIETNLSNELLRRGYAIEFMVDKI